MLPRIRALVPLHPHEVWQLSGRLHQAGHRRRARALKAANFLLFKAVLPPEARLGSGVMLGHYGLGVVVHPNSRLGARTHLHHGVTLASDATPGTGLNIDVGEDVTIGAGAILVNRDPASVLRIGNGAVIAAGAIVIRDVEPWTIVAGNPAREVARRHDVGSRGRYGAAPTAS